MNFASRPYIGHIHLRSNEPEIAIAFYTEVLGFKPHIASAAFGMFDCGTETAPHMVAFNTWGGRDLPRPPDTAAGLIAFTVELSPAAFGRLEGRLAAKRVVAEREGPALLCNDPDGNRIRLVPAGVENSSGTKR